MNGESHGTPPSYFISAGEFSGDLLAADLVRALSVRFPKHKPYGLVGESMRRAGVHEICDLETFSVMGIFDVAAKLPQLKRAESYILSKIDEIRPAFAVLVDFPGLHFRLAEQLALRGIPVFQYCAPKIWAWGQHRVKYLRRDFKHVYGILPFEQDFFREHGVNYTYVGSPHIDRVERISTRKEHFGFKENQRLLTILPGSRPSELKLIFPRLVSIWLQLKERFPDLIAAMPLAPSLSIDDLRSVLVKPELLVNQNKHKWDYCGIQIYSGMSLELMAIADAALVASGTATLECGLLETPMTVVYVMDQMSYDIAKAKVKISYISLINLMANAPVVPEYVQEFSDDDVANSLADLLTHGSGWLQMKRRLRELKLSLKGGATDSAADLIAGAMSNQYGQ